MKNVLWSLLLVGACSARGPMVSGSSTVPSSVLVHIETNEPTAVLARVSGSATAIATGPGGTATGSELDFQHICAGACNARVEPNQEYVFLNVSGFQGRSGRFVLPPHDQVTLRVDSGSQTMWFVGWVGLLLGGTGAVVGGSLWATGAAVGGSQADLGTAGEIVTLISLPVVALGMWQMLANHTSVTTDSGEQLTIRARHSKRGMGLTATGVGYTF